MSQPATHVLDPAYARQPLRRVDGIPVFCEENELTRNYDTVYEDVFQQIAAGKDPNEEDLFLQMERADVQLIQEHSTGGRILDCGVAMGRILAQLPASYEKYGFDINRPCLRQARARGIEACCAMVEDLPYRPGFFDLALCSDFLEHVFDLNGTVGSILQTLRPGGLLFVRTPWREDLSKYVQDGFPYKYHHLRNFDEHGMRLLFERVFGCEVLEHRLVGHSICPERRRWLVPYCGRLTRHSRRLSQGLHDRLIRLFYLPHEIEVVVRKPAA